MIPADSDESGIRILGEKLMHHQCWFFGRDIWHDDGNLLIRYGFERFGVPEGQKGGNAYRLTLGDDRELVIWGFGVFFGCAEGGAFIRRYSFVPKITKHPKLNLPIIKPDDLPFHRLPRSDKEHRLARELTTAIIDEFVSYELWIERECGRRWRTKCLRDWPNAELSNPQIRRGWKTLKESIGDL